MEIILHTGDYLEKRENGRFGLCPDFTGVKQYFRNVEYAMGHFILSPFGLTLILAG